MRALPAIAGAFIATCITAGANDALNFWNTNSTTSLNKRATAAPPLDIRPERQRRADPQVVALVERSARDFGVRKDVVDYTLKRESGWQVAAANPASTARGLFQVIRGTHAEIVGRPLSYAEHRALSFNPKHHVNVGMAHLRMCQDAMPGASAHRIWKGCHHDGPAAAGTTMKAARAHYARVVEGKAAPFDTARTFGIAVMPASSFVMAMVEYR
jgi:hypothetical protein